MLVKSHQMMKVFWDYTKDRRIPSLPTPPNEEQIRLSLAPNSTTCPLNKIIVGSENEGNIRTLRRFAFTACKRFNHAARGCNFGIFASSGQGKTFVVKQFAETIGIPFVFVQSASLTDTWQLFHEICEACEKFGTPVVPLKSNTSDHTLPPVIVFFDEAHSLPKKMMKGGLLNAMESDDGYMLAKPPGMKADSVVIDCKDVCWVAATTEKGLLFDAFANRLGTLIEWENASRAQVARIVKQKLDKRFEEGEVDATLPSDICLLVAKYCPVPREAISFGEKVVQQRDMYPSDTWIDAAAQIAEDLGINDDGFTEKQVMILSAAGQRPIAKTNLPSVAQCRIEQIERYELPRLISYANGGPFLVPVSGRGMAVTQATLELLDKWGVEHNGDRVTVEHFEKRR
jgi:Holliday junction resolvasome RuvABC ATP-dependent DNA helicase subunit